MTFNEKTIFLTGASSGIGREIAKALLKENCRLILASRNLEELKKLAGENKNSFSSVLPIKCDIMNKNEVCEAVESAKRKFGKIDIAILNSGISSREPVEKFSSSTAEKIFGVNVLGMVYCIEALLPDFIQRREGVIAGISSLADGRGFTRSGFYSASKAAVSKILESLRVELKKYNVKVITVKPGFVKSPMTDKNEFEMPFLMDAGKAAGIILKGISKEKSKIEFPLPTTLGAKLLKILPDPLFDYIASKV